MGAGRDYCVHNLRIQLCRNDGGKSIQDVEFETLQRGGSDNGKLAHKKWNQDGIGGYVPKAGQACITSE
jgi:hypothetical protein